MSMTCHVLPHESADGPANMALDEALLDIVANGSGTAYLRTYGWTIPTLSLGYFQKFANVRADPRWSNTAVVRRLTGGGAIWHHHEVTYALIVPVAHPMARPSKALYRTVHVAIAEILETFGVHARRRGDPVPQSLDRRNRPLLCFTDSDPEDIVSSGVKIVGSAQRRRSDAILQHGSVLLRHSDHTPELAGVCDLAPVDAAVRDVSDQLLTRIPKVLDFDPVATDVPEKVRARVAELERTVYRNADWMGLR